MFLKRYFDRNRRILKAIMSIEGQITEAECLKLVELGRGCRQGSVIIEIGSFRGRSSAALAFGSLQGNGSRVYAIDPHADFVGVRGHTFGPIDQAAFYQNISRLGLGQIVSAVSLPARSAARAWTTRNIALLWIDGDHRYEAVHDDYHDWAPYLMNDAMVAFHDASLKGVDRLMTELVQAKELHLLGTVDELAWFRRSH
jgi:predicted O-methyltransferase YrrM